MIFMVTCLHATYMSGCQLGDYMLHIIAEEALVNIDFNRIKERDNLSAELCNYSLFNKMSALLTSDFMHSNSISYKR